MNMKRYAAIAWAAGLFEGEGTFYLKSPEKVQIVACLQTTDEDVLRRFHRIVAVGHLYGPYVNGRSSPRSHLHKPIYQWRADGHEKVQYIAALLWRGLGGRRRAQAERALDGYLEVRPTPRRRRM